jgi:hypothetical protein
VLVIRNLWHNYNKNNLKWKEKGKEFGTERHTVTTLTDWRLAFLRQLWILPLFSLSLLSARQFLSLPDNKYSRHLTKKTWQCLQKITGKTVMGFPLWPYCTHSLTLRRPINTRISTLIIYVIFVNCSWVVTGGSSTVHIYTQTIHGTRQITIEEHK